MPMTLADVDLISDGPGGELVPAKAALRAVLAIDPELSSAISSLMTAILLATRGHPQERRLIAVAASGLDLASRIELPLTGAGGLPS